MKKLGLAAIFGGTMLAYAAPAWAMTYYLTSQWMDHGNRFCRYGNGTVLNVGVQICPMSIQG